MARKEHMLCSGLWEAEENPPPILIIRCHMGSCVFRNSHMYDILGTNFLDDLAKMVDDKNIKVNVSLTQNQGDRLTQQDRFLFMNIRVGYFALVCDGHGRDAYAADEVVINIANVFRDEYQAAIQKYGIDLTHINEKKLISRVLTKLHNLTCDFVSGTTVSLIVIRPILRNKDNQRQLRLTLATLGDSPLSVCDSGIYTHMPLHTAQYFTKDRTRIEESDTGYFESGYLFSNSMHPRYGGIAMTRALGDKDFNDVLSRQPSMKSFDVSSDAVIVLASDGVLQNYEPSNVRKTMQSFIEQSKNGKSAEDILNKIEDIEDNATFISISFNED